MRIFSLPEFDGRRHEPKGAVLPGRRGRRWGLVLLTGGLLLAATGCTNLTQTSKRFAKPWSPGLRPLFDDVTDVCAPWTSSQEPWARREHELTSRRCQNADIVAVGRIEEVVDTLSGGNIKQMVLHFHVDKMVRGTLADLPDGKPRITLVVSPKEDTTIPKKMIRRRAVLALRWLKGDDPPFRWHITCATNGVQKLIRRHLKARERQEKGETPEN